MQHVTEEVAKKIELAVERIKSGKYAECPAEHGIGKNTINGEVNFCPKRYLVTGRVIDPSRDCPPCWREACLDYIREHAPTDKVEGAEYIAIEPSSPCTTTAVPAGDILTLSHDDKTDRPHFTDAAGQKWWVWLKSVRRISSLTAPEQPEPEEKPEPVKLYCVKPLSGWLTVGKVYESTDGWMMYDDDGRRVDSVCIREGHLFPLVSRPAKVGEWVYLVEEPLVNDTNHLAGDYAVNFHKGDLVKITYFGSMPSVKSKDGKTHSGFREHEYLVLDGYDGCYEEQPKPSAETALRDRIKHLEQENAMLEAENAKLCAQLTAARRALD